MLVSNEISKNQYVGDGSATEFAYTFPILDATHIEVYRQLPTETAFEAKLVLAEEYTVEGAGAESGGKVVFKVAPSSGTKLSILRNVPITQLYQYQELDSFPAESHENALAKLTMICQGLDERLDRAIGVSPTDTVTPDELRNNMFEASQKAQDSASAAKDSEMAAAASESSASNSATAASESASNASNSASAAAASEAAAAGSASAAASSAQNAAESENNAANSAAAILELKIEVNTLNPGEQATGSYDPVTGILTLSVPKGDPGASAIATPTSLGSVMPKTGDNDGLELGADGTLRVRQATDTQLGGVTLSSSLESNSTTAAATSYAVKMLNDTKISTTGGNLYGTLNLFESDRHIGILRSDTNFGTRVLLSTIQTVPSVSLDLLSATPESPNKRLFHLTIGEKDRVLIFGGNSDGDLYWNNKHIVRSINGIDADRTGNVNIGQNIVTSGVSGDIWYRKWSDGFIEQGWIHSGGTGNETRNRTFTFPIPYTSTNYGLVGVGFEIANTSRQGVTKTNTGFTTFSVEHDCGTLSWYAFGY